MCARVRAEVLGRVLPIITATPPSRSSSIVLDRPTNLSIYVRVRVLLRLCLSHEGGSYAYAYVLRTIKQARESRGRRERIAFIARRSPSTRLVFDNKNQTYDRTADSRERSMKRIDDQCGRAIGSIKSPMIPTDPRRRAAALLESRSLYWSIPRTANGPSRAFLPRYPFTSPRSTLRAVRWLPASLLSRKRQDHELIFL